MIRLTALIELEGQSPRALTHESRARTVVIGRDGSADFQLPLSTISRQHARITATDGVYVLEDLGSTHGTLLNGRKLGPGEKKVLRHGDVVELDRARITAGIEQEKAAAADPGEGTQAIAARAVQGILGRLGEAQGEGPYFRVLGGAAEGARFPLSGAQLEWTLGRSRDCEIVLDDPNVSRRHAQVRKDWSGFTLHDLGSRNGVAVNDELVHAPRRLRDEDEVTVGPVKLVFIDPGAELLEALADVPGFQLEAPASAKDAPSHPGAPGGGGEAPAAVAPAPQPGGEPELGAIDPELLEPPRGKLPSEWLVIAAGAAVLGAVGLAIAYLLV